MSGPSGVIGALAAFISKQVRAQVEERLDAAISLDQSSLKAAKLICWTPPPPNVYKANFDAAVWEGGGSTAACVIRNAAGNLLLAAGWRCGYSVVPEAETRAAWETVRVLHAYFHDKRVWLEWDVLSVIQDCYRDSSI